MIDMYKISTQRSRGFAIYITYTATSNEEIFNCRVIQSIMEWRALSLGVLVLTARLRVRSIKIRCLKLLKEKGRDRFEPLN